MALFPGASLSCRDALERPVPFDDAEEGLPQDLDVEPERIVAHVVDVVLGMQVQDTVAAPIDLPPSCEPLRHEQPPVLPGAVMLGNPRQLRAWADHRHITLEDVEQLRELIEARPTQESANARDAGVASSLMHKSL